MTATVRFHDDGSVANNSIGGSNAESDEVNDLYVMTFRNGKNIAYGFSDSLKTSDEEAERYASYLNNFEINGHSLGDIAREATEYPVREYEKYAEVGKSVEAKKPTEAEMELLPTSMSNASGKVSWGQATDVRVPTTHDGEGIPLLVGSSERFPSLQSFEEAKEVVEKVVSDRLNIKGATVEEASNDAAEQAEEQSDSDTEGLLTGAKGVGSDVSENIRTYIVDERVNIDWREHVDPENEEWFETVEPEPQEVPELTSSEVRERYENVKEDMDDFDQEIVKKRIIDGDLYDAVDTIENHE